MTRRRWLAAVVTSAATVVASVLVVAAPSSGATAGHAAPAAVGAQGASSSVAASSFVPRPDMPRLLLTRVSTGPIPGGGTLDVQVTGREGIPSTGVSAVVLTVEAYLARYRGWAVVYPTGDPRPATSTLNYVPGRGTANTVILPVGVDGKVTIYASATSEFHVSLQGYYLAAPTASALPPSEYTPVTPTRVLDTRHGVGAPQGPVTGGQALPLTVAGAGDVPADAAAVVLNVTVPAPHARGFVTAYPHGEARPWTSAVNVGRDQTLAGLVVSKVGDGGQVDLYPSTTTNLVADVLGWIPAGTTYHPLTPRRTMDTRTGLGDPVVWKPWDLPWDRDPRTVAGFRLAGRVGVPADATAVLVTITVVGAPTKGRVDVYPVGASPTWFGVNSFVPDEAIAAAAVAVPGRDGRVRVLTTVRAKRYLVDVVGYWTAAP